MKTNLQGEEIKGWRVIDKRLQTEEIIITFDVEGGLTREEIRDIMNQLQIVITQRPRVVNFSAIRT